MATRNDTQYVHAVSQLKDLGFKSRKGLAGEHCHNVTQDVMLAFTNAELPLMKHVGRYFLRDHGIGYDGMKIQLFLQRDPHQDTGVTKTVHTDVIQPREVIKYSLKKHMQNNEINELEKQKILNLLDQYAQRNSTSEASTYDLNQFEEFCHQFENLEKLDSTTLYSQDNDGFSLSRKIISVISYAHRLNEKQAKMLCYLFSHKNTSQAHVNLYVKYKQEYKFLLVKLMNFVIENDAKLALHYKMYNKKIKNQQHQNPFISPVEPKSVLSRLDCENDSFKKEYYHYLPVLSQSTMDFINAKRVDAKLLKSYLHALANDFMSTNDRTHRIRDWNFGPIVILNLFSPSGMTGEVFTDTGVQEHVYDGINNNKLYEVQGVVEEDFNDLD